MKKFFVLLIVLILITLMVSVFIKNKARNIKGIVHKILTDFNGELPSDKDLLQLISDKVTVKLLKSKDYIMMDENTFMETYGIERGIAITKL